MVVGTSKLHLPQPKGQKEQNTPELEGNQALVHLKGPKSWVQQIQKQNSKALNGIYKHIFKDNTVDIPCVVVGTSKLQLIPMGKSPHHQGTK